MASPSRRASLRADQTPSTQSLTNPSSALPIDSQHSGTNWGENFWITIIDPSTRAQFYACPSTGEATWDPPEGHFVMPPNEDGEWWELVDETRNNTPYFYQTKTGETSWTRPEGFVIPLGIIQTTTALGRRFSQNARKSVMIGSSDGRRVRVQSQTSAEPSSKRAPASPDNRRRSLSASNNRPSTSARLFSNPQSNGLYTIPSSTEPSTAGGNSIKSIQRSSALPPASPSKPTSHHHHQSSTASRTSPPIELLSQSLTGMAELLAAQDIEDRKRTHVSQSRSSSPAGSSSSSPTSSKSRKFSFGMKKLATSSNPNITLSGANDHGTSQVVPPSPTPSSRRMKLLRSPGSNTSLKDKEVPRPGSAPPSPSPNRPKSMPAKPRFSSKPSVMEIGSPVMDATKRDRLNPLSAHGSTPVFVPSKSSQGNFKRLSTGTHRTLPRDLAEEIQQFLTSDFAKLYFSTQRTGVFFRRTIPVEQMMSWQKAPITSPLLVLNRTLHKDAVKIFKVIQRVMGDREGNKPVGVVLDPPPGHLADYYSKYVSGSSSLLEEERWLLNQGILHGELRDEIYCQTVKQLNKNPNMDSVFHGFQLLCVLLVTFPPSKNLESYLLSFLRERRSQSENRIDVMAKYCITRLSIITKKGPRGKPPTIAEIETASDAAFNPSTFGESLESVFRLQQRTYPDAKIPIILPFLADGIIALGGTKTEGTWRVSGDGDLVSELRVRIDKGYYNLEGIDDCHVPASLLKLWLRELAEPLIPEAMYNDCLACATDPEKVIGMVKELPTINRRVLLFVISFLQLFLREEIQTVTKMTSVNLALVMAPNLLRCNSDQLSTVFANTQHEHAFVHNLLIHLKPARIDPDYIPVHGQGASASTSSTSIPLAQSLSGKPRR